MKVNKITVPETTTITMEFDEEETQALYLLVNNTYLNPLFAAAGLNSDHIFDELFEAGIINANRNSVAYQEVTQLANDLDRGTRQRKGDESSW